MTDALRALGIDKTYGRGKTAVHACAGIDLRVASGELLVIRGRSGSGKTTLLNCLGGLDRPDAGQVWIGDRELTAMQEAERVELRQRHLGFVFQGFGLLPMLTAAENVEVPLRIVGTAADVREERVAELLELVGLTAHRDQRPGELSGGQQQRVGIARALANEPQLLIADEPTGQLDALTAASVMDLLRGLTETQGVAVIVTTHDPQLADRADRVLHLHDGALAGTP
ncbi:ABC transporter ATP-binding protein [Arthrobacter rhombi]|uniref:ABC transporter ATP-binding protein n=1 Tax=Arthrobacter rhombi TaxID=71253 RepID=UPI0031D3C4FC